MKSKKKIRPCLLCALLALAGGLQANQPGAIDPTFRTGGGANGAVRAIVPLPSGKILIGGDFLSVQQVPRRGIARLLATGAVDLTFNPGSGVGTGVTVNAIAVQADGKVLIGGDFTSYNGTAAAPDRIVRLNANGSLDNTFNSGGSGANNTISAIAVQSDGKVLIGGLFTSYNGAAAPDGIARLNTDGSLDTTFNPGGAGANIAVNAIAVQADGKVLIGGAFTSYNGDAAAPDHIVRLNDDGSLNTTFNPGGAGADGSVSAIAVQSDGKVLIGGSFSLYNGDAAAPDRIARLKADGTLDATFNPGGAGAGGDIRTMAVQADGKVLIGGNFITYNGAAGRAFIVRLNDDGILDATFNPGGAGANINLLALAVQADGKVLIGGLFTSYNGTGRNRIARLATTGVLDHTFNPVSGTNFEVYTLAVQADGKVLIGGFFTGINGDAAAPDFIARLKADGSLDATFNTGGLGANNAVNALAVQADGKVLIGGNFTGYNGAAAAPVFIARLKADGSLDASFNTGGLGASKPVNVLAVQKDGMVLIGGSFTSYNDAAAPDGIARLDANGILDAAFNSGGTGVDSIVLALALQEDGMVLIGGSFASYNGVAAAPDSIARLNANGSLDGTFNPGGAGANNTVRAIAVQADGKVLIGGAFTSYNGDAAAPDRIVRLNVDGTLDATFNPGGAGAGGEVRTIAVQVDGSVLIGGSFSTYNGTGRSRIARLNADGSLDTGFNPGLGAFGSVRSLVLQPDGKALIGGDFTSYDGRTADRIARVLTDHHYVPTVFTGISIADPANRVLLGRFTLNLERGGAFSGSLLLDTSSNSPTLGVAERIALVGTFDREGVSLLQTTRKDGSALYIDLLLTRDDFGGAIVQGTAKDVAGRQSELTALAPFFSSGRLPANHFAGRYHVGLHPPGGVVAGALPPSGSGYLVLTVTTAGTMTLAGKNGDGSSLTASVNLGSNGDVLAHFPLYASKGGLTGSLNIDEQTLAPDPRPVVGTMVWRRPPNPTFPAGFSFEISPTGSQYLPKAATLPPFGGTPANSVRVKIAGGNLSATGAASHVSFALTGTGVVQGGGQINSLKVTVDRSTGLFTGSFVPAASTAKVTIQGLITESDLAVGYALVPGSPFTLPSAVLLDVLNP